MFYVVPLKLAKALSTVLEINFKSYTSFLLTVEAPAKPTHSISACSSKGNFI